MLILNEIIKIIAWWRLGESPEHFSVFVTRGTIRLLKNYIYASN